MARAARPRARRRLWAWRRACVASILPLAVLVSIAARADDLVERGAYLAAAGGCASCHTDTAAKGAPFAGGRALVTPMGTFHGPNITPDAAHGIGAWSDADFRNALRHGVGRGGVLLYPAFPYPSFTGISDDDANAIKAYLFSLPPAAQANKPHDLHFPFNLRILMRVWNSLFFTVGPFKPDPSQTPVWNRGAYLVQALGHCGECHTPRNLLGAVERDKAYSGTPDGPDGKVVPNITPDRGTGIGKWSENDLVYFLDTGIDPDGDVTGSVMGEVVKNSTGKLTAEDRRAIATYLRSVPPIVHRVKRRAP